MTDDEIRDYARTLILEHATDIEFMSIFEMAETYLPGGDISDEDARRVDALLSKAAITVSFPETAEVPE